MPTVTLSREDTAAAYARHRTLHEARRWTDLADLFAEDGRYWEPFFGELNGREAVRDFLRESMAGLEEWVFPITWTAIDEGRVVTQWFNRLPNPRRDGTPFQFRGISNIAYDDDGMIVSQEDSYDRIEALRVLAEARSPLLERFNGMVLRTASPMFALAKRVTGFAG